MKSQTETSAVIDCVIWDFVFKLSTWSQQASHKQYHYKYSAKTALENSRTPGEREGLQVTSSTMGKNR